jgi:hypothetical protein
MHGLSTIIRRNEEAAGREAGHAFNDGDHEKASRILDAETANPGRLTSPAFVDGYLRGREEDPADPSDPYRPRVGYWLTADQLAAEGR